MANKKSPAAQAIKDMLELGMDVTFFVGNITKFHVLNAEISISTKERVKRQKRERLIKVCAPKPIPKSKHVYNQRIIINIDGTVSIEMSEWDYK